MRKLILLILEINGLVFAWYVFMGIAIIGIDMATNGFLGHMGIARSTIYWIVGVSAALKAAYMAIPALKRSPRLIRTLTLARMRELLSFSLVIICIVWGAFWYDKALAIADIAGNGGIPHGMISIAMACILFLGAFINAREGDEEGTANAGENDGIKESYRNREESSVESGKGAIFPLWRYAHETEYQSIVRCVPRGAKALDNGCGDGTLAIMLAKKGVIVTACDISSHNIGKAEKHAEEAHVEDKIKFLIADAEHLPFEDDSFDWIVSSHVLEHLPDFEKGLAEIKRVTKKNAVIALPTCMNPCAAVILGGDIFWTISRWSPFAWFIGLGRILMNVGGVGVDEGYRGDKSLPHVWRYPHVMRQELKKGGFRIMSFQASSLCLPYMNALVPIIRKLDRYKASPIIRNFGYGSIAVVEK